MTELSPEELALLREIAALDTGVLFGIDKPVFLLKDMDLITWDHLEFHRGKSDRVIGARLTDAGRAYLAEHQEVDHG